MAKKVLEKTVEVCDVCHGESTLLSACIICKREHCYTCKGIIMGCVVRADVCRECADRKDVQRICDRYAGRLAAAVKKRNAELRELGDQPIE